MAARTKLNDPVELVVAGLKELLGDRLSTAVSVREHLGGDESYHKRYPADAVAFARSTDEVSAIVKICALHACPVIPFGTGTGLEGGTAALHGGICIDVSGMAAVIEINSEDLDCRVQCGVTRKQLNEHLRDTGFFFPIDPGADASLGGMAATRASGTNAVRYGTMRENVLGLTVVLADGRIIRTGGRARKSAAVCQFESLDDAVNSVIQTIQTGIPVARIELLDDVQMGACIDYSNLKGYAAKPTLMFEFHGTDASVREQAEMTGAIISEFGGGDFKWTAHAEDRNKLWQARHDAYYAALKLRPGRQGLATDVCVPIAQLAECLLETKRDIDQSGLLAPIVGHVGDGNFHLLLLVDPEDEEEMASVNALNERLVHRALAMGGTSTGEHGVGYGKVDFMTAEHGDAISVMRAIKNAIDPDTIMNPGKVFRM